jgi:hypothetical protein
MAVAAALGLALLSSGPALAVDRIKANNATNLDQGGSWVGGAIPGTADVGVWNSTVVGANSTVLGSDQNWSGLRIANPGGTVTSESTNRRRAVRCPSLPDDSRTPIQWS